ncbi:MAG: sugar ABC transporter permease [Spirochaetales bacterium]|nr:sugar ABC transporter permease [Spirochaetales bacterium]
MLELSTKKTYALKKGLLLFGLLGPAFLLFTMFIIVPVIQAGFFSFFRWRGGPFKDNAKWYGIKNFIFLFRQKIFLTAILNNLKIVLYSLLFQLPIAFLFALMVGKNRYFGSSVFRSFYFFPYVLTEIVVGIIWRFIYHPEFGLPTMFHRFFTGSGAQGSEGLASQVAWLGNPNMVFGAIFVVIFWKYIGFHMILYIAGLQNVSKDLEDAAVIDGANKFQVVWHVVIPSIRSTIVISVFLSVIGSFNVFDVVWAMGKGDPANAAETLVTYLYKFGFNSSKYGYASAVAVIIFLICLVFNIVYQKYVVGDSKK